MSFITEISQYIFAEHGVQIQNLPKCSKSVVTMILSMIISLSVKSWTDLRDDVLTFRVHQVRKCTTKLAQYQ